MRNIRECKTVTPYLWCSHTVSDTSLGPMSNNRMARTLLQKPRDNGFEARTEKPSTWEGAKRKRRLFQSSRSGQCRVDFQDACVCPASEKESQEGTSCPWFRHQPKFGLPQTSW